MSNPNRRPMTRGFRKAALQNQTFLTPEIPASKLKKKQAHSIIPPKSQNFNSQASPNPFKADNNSLPFFQNPSPSYSEITSFPDLVTPTGTKLIKPDQRAFNSTGILLKKNQLKQISPKLVSSASFIPETPSKKPLTLVSTSPPKISFSLPLQTSDSSSFQTPPHSLIPPSLGKHPNSSVESLLSNKRRYISPCENPAFPSTPTHKPANYPSLLSQSFFQDDSPLSQQNPFFPLQENDLVNSDPITVNENSDSLSPQNLLSSFPNTFSAELKKSSLSFRPRNHSFATSEVETTFSSTSTLKAPTSFPNKAEPNVKHPKYHFQLHEINISNLQNLDHLDFLRPESPTSSSNLVYPQQQKIDSNNQFSDPETSPLIVPQERPQMPQILNNCATNFPHILSKQFFAKFSLFNSFSPISSHEYPFQPTPHDHCPVNESGYVDYYSFMFDELAQIGKGNFSNVYMSRSLEDGKTYAIKKSIKPFSGRKDRILKLKEVDILYHLLSASPQPHPNIATIYNCWEQFGLLYIQSELCDEGNLKSAFSQHFCSSPVPEPSIWKITSCVSTALAFIHEQGFIHLDIKPDNICITSKGEIKIVDFGHALHTCNLQSSFSPSQNVYYLDAFSEGDRVYLAPESLNPISNSSDVRLNSSRTIQITPAVDIFSLGLIILEMAANVVLPHNGPEWTALRDNDISSARLDPNSISTDLNTLLLSCLESDPKKRPSALTISNLDLAKSHYNSPLFP
ncbi:hypothetical protein BB560_006717 [Smittium megazygosporum]|uniref:Protein kinase domain-containing protein n=1 Tax=Smittium megazygosporum TaxID=133381 RepID=A0A2T9Y280_9FUNG|nr:hypothetical protein BB560_006717 [Smittium megazygosporum]